MTKAETTKLLQFLERIADALETANEPLIETVEEPKEDEPVIPDPAIKPVTPQGYSCWYCGVWVPTGTFHNCRWTPAPYQPNPYPYKQRWRCGICGTWVGTHQYHSCSGTPWKVYWGSDQSSPNQCGSVYTVNTGGGSPGPGQPGSASSVSYTGCCH